MNKPIPTLNDPWVRWARLIGALFVAAVVLALFSGCNGKNAFRHMILVDAESGCKYVGYVEDGALSNASLKPVVGVDGKQVCK